MAVNEGDLSFTWWWDKAAEYEATDGEPWEDFSIVLHGREAGDLVDSPSEVARILTEAGYRLVRSKGSD